MPASMSIERRRLLKALGACCINSTWKRNERCNWKVNEIKKPTPNSFYSSTISKCSKPKFIDLQQQKEILADTDGKIDIFVAAIEQVEQ